MDGELQRAALAASIGLLIGIERGWQEREAQDGSRVAGIRTFALVGTLGGFCGLLAAGDGGALLGLCFLGFALGLGAFEFRRARQAGTYSATDLIAGLLTFILGAYAARGSMMVAAAGGVVTAAILAERRLLHSFLLQLRWIELRAGLALLVMTAVLLPVLPDRAVDPWGALNPHEIWLMTVLVGIVCFAGYAAVRIAGERRGLLYAGIMGGLATSTTVTWTFARLARRDPALRPAVTASILVAWAVSLVRMTGLAVVVAPALLAPLTPPVTAASLLLLAGAALAYRRAGHAPQAPLALQNPFEPGLLLRFTALFVLILLLAKWLSHGETGMLFALGGLSGVLDVDPVTLSMAEMTRTGTAPAIAAVTILLAAASNVVAKTVLGWGFGGRRLGMILSLAAAASIAVSAAAWWASR